MSAQIVQTVRKAGFSLEDVADRLGVLLLLALGLSTAGATIMTGL